MHSTECYFNQMTYCICNKYVSARTGSMKNCIPLCNGFDFLFLLQWMNWKVILIFKILTTFLITLQKDKDKKKQHLLN